MFFLPKKSGMIWENHSFSHILHMYYEQIVDASSSKNTLPVPKTSPPLSRGTVKGPGVFASAEGRRLGRPRVGVLGRTVVTTGFFAERGALVFTLEIFTTVLAGWSWSAMERWEKYKGSMEMFRGLDHETLKHP